MTPYQADFSFDNFQRCQLSSPWWFVFIFFAHGGWWETAHFNIFGSCKHHEKFPHVLWGSLNLQTFRRIPCENSSGWTSVGVRHQVYAMMTTCNLEADTDGPPERKWMVFKGCCRGFSDFGVCWKISGFLVFEWIYWKWGMNGNFVYFSR